MATSRGAELAVVRGSPRRLSGVVPLGLAMGLQGELRLLDDAGKPTGEPVQAALRPSGAEGLARVKFKMRRTLPPGRYNAQLVVHGDPHVFAFEVEPLPMLRAEPPMLRLHAAPGATAATTLTLINQGNVAVDVPDRAAVGVFEDDGVENAIARAYRADTEDGLQIFKAFVEGLRASYGNMLNLQVVEGAGPLKPGEARTLRLSLAVPDRLRARRVYTGFWSLANLSYTIEVSVGDAKEGRTEPR